MRLAFYIEIALLEASLINDEFIEALIVRTKRDFPAIPKEEFVHIVQEHIADYTKYGPVIFDEVKKKWYGDILIDRELLEKIKRWGKGVFNAPLCIISSKLANFRIHANSSDESIVAEAGKQYTISYWHRIAKKAVTT